MTQFLGTFLNWRAAVIAKHTEQGLTTQFKTCKLNDILINIVPKQIQELNIHF